MKKRVLSGLLVVALALGSSSIVRADEVEETVIEVATDEVNDEAEVVSASSEEYQMILDPVTGDNIENFYIARPDPAVVSSNKVNACDFGLSTENEDNYAALTKALEYCKENPGTYLEIDKGVYYFKTDASLRLDGFKNILIDGNGSDFIFQTQKQFAVNGCDGVEIRDLNIDWNWEEDRVGSLVQVQNKHEDYFDLVFLELDEVDEDIPIVSFQQYDKVDHVPGTYGSWKTFNPVEVPGSITSVKKIGSNVLRIGIDKKYFTTTFHNEDTFILRHYTYGGSVFNVNGGSSNITFDNVNIYGSAGMGYVFADKSNHFQIINSAIGLRPGNEDKQRMSTSADGIHILNTGGYFRIQNCDFSYTGDDIINIHDDLLRVSEVYDSRSSLIGEVTGSFVQKGDTIRIYNANIENVKDADGNVFEAEVLSFTRSGENGTLTLDKPLPEGVGAGCYIYRSSTRTRNYVISGNYIHETKGRGALLNAPDGLFTENTLYRTVSECVQVRVDLAVNNPKRWFEGSGANNVVISNNTFEECAFGGKDCIITIDCNVGNNKSVLSDIYITNNVFEWCYAALISADNVSNLYIQNNQIVDCGEIKISDYCGAVYNSNNTITYPSRSCLHTDTKQVGDRAASCIQYGTTGDKYCNQCHKKIGSYSAISPLRHKGYATAITSDTGEESRYHRCSLCNDVEMHNSSGSGGTCKACGYTKSVIVQSMSLELDQKNIDFIGINLYVEGPNDAVFYIDGEMVESAVLTDGGLWKIQYKCAPKELADEHVLTVKNGINKKVNISGKTEYIYNGDEYCRYVVSAGSTYSEAVKNVCESLLKYSEQARIYFGYNNVGLTSGTISASIPTSGYSMSTTGELPNGCTYIGSSLVLGDELTVRHYFSGDYSELVFTCTNKAKLTDNTVTVGHMESVPVVYVDIRIPYSNINDMYELNIVVDKDSTLYTLSYGVLTYCQNACELNADSKLINLCKSLYNYSDAIIKYKK